MSNLNTNDKLILEKLFQMGDGYILKVLGFSDRTFGEFFRDEIQVDIYDDRYKYASGSKANRMRGFWQAADDLSIGKSIDKLIAYIETQVVLDPKKRSDFPEELINHARSISSRLQGKTSHSAVTVEEFIRKDFGEVSFAKLGLDQSLIVVLEQRTDEIKRCLSAKAPLAVIFLCGSSLEGVLLGVACNNPAAFNQSSASPKDKYSKVKAFPDWTLNDLINVASDLRFVGEDVKKFSHALRDFRNYIHPYEQMSKAFNPDAHTAEICWRVLQAAISQLSK